MANFFYFDLVQPTLNQMRSKSNKENVKDLKGGDGRAFDEIFLKFNRKVYHFSLSYLKNPHEAQDIVQEVFLSLWKNRHRHDVQADLQPYLFAITFNAIKKRFRKLERERKHVEAYALAKRSEKVVQSGDNEKDQLREWLENSLQQLPPRQRDIFILNKQEGLTAQEIADKLGLSRRTVENHLFRARAFLKTLRMDEHLSVALLLWLSLP